MGAEKNLINSVDENEFSVTGEIERKLSINKIDGSKLINLSNNTEFNTVKVNVTTAQDNISSIQQTLNSINSQITGITTNYVMKSTYETDIANIWDRLTWHDLD